MNDKVYTLYSPNLKRISLTLFRKFVSAGFSDDDKCVRIISVNEGRGNISCNGIDEDFFKGDVFIFDKGKNFFFTEATDTEIFLMKFNLSDFIDADYKVFEKEAVGKFFSRIESTGEKLRGIHINTKKIQDAIFMIEKEFESENSSTGYVIKAYTILILSLISQYLLDGLDDGGINRCKNYKNIKKSLEFINDNLSEKLTLDELARVANMGKTNYSAAFKNVTGMTVWEYIINARIEFASNYLIEKRDEFNITEIAMMSGFNNAAHFSKIFKKIKGNTPSEFKNNSNNPCF